MDTIVTALARPTWQAKQALFKQTNIQGVAAAQGCVRSSPQKKRSADMHLALQGHPCIGTLYISVTNLWGPDSGPAEAGKLP
jgi:hypothetical protein